MTFTTGNGTRGRRTPPKWFAQMGNRMFVRRIRGGAGSVAGGNGLVLVTRGRKSGQRRETPVAWFPGPDDSWIIAAAYNGSASNPDWYWNLSADPDGATIVVKGEEIEVRAEEL
nr:nitroreductase family deazaflavin-dependent oxidoreductase [Actinomycetota bacterium]